MHLKSYIHDRIVVFFNLAVILLGIYTSILVLLGIGDMTRSVATISNNTTLGIAGFEKASVSSLYQFLLIAVIIVAGNTILSIRMHAIKRGASLFVLGLTVVALVFLIVISTAILGINR